MSLLLIFAPATLLAAIFERPRKVKVRRYRPKEITWYWNR